jgi:hypothetical protein
VLAALEFQDWHAATIWHAAAGVPLTRAQQMHIRCFDVALGLGLWLADVPLLDAGSALLGPAWCLDMVCYGNPNLKLPILLH